MDLGQFLYTIKKIEIQVFSFFLMLNRTAVTYNIKYLAAAKIDAFLKRTAARDIFDASFLLQHYPDSVGKELIEKCKSKLSGTGLDQMENIIKNDEIIKNFDCEGILVNFENNIDKYLCNDNKATINARSRSRKR
jgi:predicted nucleotidyltransferase component of viral defense system